MLEDNGKPLCVVLLHASSIEYHFRQLDTRYCSQLTPSFICDKRLHSIVSVSDRLVLLPILTGQVAYCRILVPLSLDLA